MREVQAPEADPPAEEEEAPILPVRGAREEDEGWERGSSKSFRSARRGLSLGCKEGKRRAVGGYTIVGVYELVVLDGWVMVVFPGGHCGFGCRLVVRCSNVCGFSDFVMVAIRPGLSCAIARREVIAIERCRRDG
jgi:hypothetical protein